MVTTGNVFVPNAFVPTFRKYLRIIKLSFAVGEAPRNKNQYTFVKTVQSKPHKRWLPWATFSYLTFSYQNFINFRKNKFSFAVGETPQNKMNTNCKNFQIKDGYHGQRFRT